MAVAAERICQRLLAYLAFIKNPPVLFFQDDAQMAAFDKERRLQQRLYVRGRVRSRKRMLRKNVGGIHPYIVG
ncbi:hypothetical protein C0Q88_13975 [Ralstonia pickettii]|uniref:Uncharacterized protein n=1 Tax=Ralstonia pickettii TaxID=329 RepID=A0A2N4TTI5_RALPI|nr:hypothetical protein C0Q88_13975 [Ralstonia pickettii]